jgi:hypothetical protein
MPDVTIYFNIHPENMDGHYWQGPRHTKKISTGKYSCEGYFYNSSNKLTRNIYFPVLDCGFIDTSQNVEVIKKDIEGDSNFGDLDTSKDLKYIITGVKAEEDAGYPISWFSRTSPTTITTKTADTDKVTVTEDSIKALEFLADSTNQFYEYKRADDHSIFPTSESYTADIDPMIIKVLNGSNLTYDSKYIDGGRIVDGPHKE